MTIQLTEALPTEEAEYYFKPKNGHKIYMVTVFRDGKTLMVYPNHDEDEAIRLHRLEGMGRWAKINMDEFEVVEESQSSETA